MYIRMVGGTVLTLIFAAALTAATANPLTKRRQEAIAPVIVISIIEVVVNSSNSSNSNNSNISNITCHSNTNSTTINSHENQRQ